MVTSSLLTVAVAQTIRSFPAPGEGPPPDAHPPPLAAVAVARRASREAS